MYSVNPDLLRASGSYHTDGKPKDPHAHHRAEHLAFLRAQRRARWAARLRHLLQALTSRRTAPDIPCPVLPLGPNTQSR